ncbi:MAG: GAF domain-containing protein, partial [Anaerolineae bacterium]|nr:GAF domain-containing protein [Anaerolineae bacterium]
MAEGVYRYETDLLYAASNRLTQASNPEELLEAITLYARESGAVSALLFYVLTDAHGIPVELEAMAQWSLGRGIIAEVGTIARIDELGMQALYDTNQARPIFVENTADTENLPERASARYHLAGIASSVMLLLANKDRWIGGVSINWAEPRTFEDRDRRIYTALSQLAAPIIDSIQLLDQTRRRAAEMEAVHNEIDLLYT